MKIRPYVATDNHKNTYICMHLSGKRGRLINNANQELRLTPF